MKKSQHPVATRICSFIPCKEIVYQCPRCSTSFQTLQTRVLFCYHCGTPIDWNGVPVQLKESLLTLWNKHSSNTTIEEYEASVINTINKKLHPDA